jgi:hypothetical protein
VANSLPTKINEYFGEIRDCFIFGHFYAAVGLCRVLIELCFRDKYQKFGFENNAKTQNVRRVPDNINIVIRGVCSKLRSNPLKDEATELYGAASNILHGREAHIKLDETEVLKFIRSAFKLIEQLYDLG